MNKIFLLLSLTPLLFADIIGGIAVTIDDETISLYEIKQEQEISKQSIKKTVDQLIRTKLEQIEAKKRNISISNQEVLDDLKKMAGQNNMTLTQFYEAMSSARHLSESQTKSKTREKLLKQKLFNAVAMSQMQEPTDEEVQEYYKLHLKEYQLPNSIDTVVYSSQNQDALKQKISNPMMNIPEVQTQNTSIETARVNPTLSQVLVNTEDGQFTPVLPQGGSNGYISFYILKKNDITTPELEVIRTQVEDKLMQDNRDHILNEHFQRMRVNADIKVLRLPEE